MRAKEFVIESKQIVERDGIQLDVTIDGANVDIRAISNGRQLGYVIFDRDGNTLVADDLSIDDRYKGQGIAAIMYDYAKELGFKVKRSSDQTTAGKYFWDKNKGEEGNVWENNELDEVKMDSHKGAGAVSVNADVDYFGTKVLMEPLQWLRMATELTVDSSTEEKILSLTQYIKDGGAIAPPFFNIEIPEEWQNGDFSKPAHIIGHEGRHRMEAILKAEGNAPVEVHLFPLYLRARHLTPEWIDALNKNIISERGQLITGPWFKQ